MEPYFSFLEEFYLFLLMWESHISSIAFAAIVWIAIVLHLIITGHATLGSNGDSYDIACGDTRVWRALVIFGGPAGLSFGLPWFWLMQTSGISGGLYEYVTGFVYVQFATSVIQGMLFFLYVAFGPKGVNTVRLFKAHLKGCGWVSGLSPIGWVMYLVQQFLPNSLKTVMWILRDIETFFVFMANLVIGVVPVVCIAGSVLNMRLIIPWISWIDEDHANDEDSDSSDHNIK